MVVQDRELREADVAQIRALIERHPEWTRRRLSLALCELWDWRNPAGRLEDMSCRNLLLKLHRRDLIELPAPTRRPPQLNRRIRRRFDDQATRPPVHVLCHDAVPSTSNQPEPELRPGCIRPNREESGQASTRRRCPRPCRVWCRQ